MQLRLQRNRLLCRCLTQFATRFPQDVSGLAGWPTLAGLQAEFGGAGEKAQFDQLALKLVSLVRLHVRELKREFQFQFGIRKVVGYQ